VLLEGDEPRADAVEEGGPVAGARGVAGRENVGHHAAGGEAQHEDRPGRGFEEEEGFGERRQKGGAGAPAQRGQVRVLVGGQGVVGGAAHELGEGDRAAAGEHGEEDGRPAELHGEADVARRVPCKTQPAGVLEDRLPDGFGNHGCTAGRSRDVL
jgi:hypothetical protein